MKITLAILLLLLPTVSMAGLFGADNYDDCVLEKMKNQPKSMISYARNACRREFPKEESIYNKEDFDINLLSYTWTSSTHNSISVTIKKNDTPYKITKMEVSLSKMNCEKAKSNDDFSQKAMVVFDNFFNKNLANTEIEKAGNYRCMRVKNIYGQLKN